MDKTIQTLTEVLQMSKEGTKPYDTTAEVVRIEGQTAWVHIPGGIDETPVSMTIDARVGDIVQVRVSGGRAWITGNASAPPTDDTVAVAARSLAVTADENAQEAQTLSEAAKRQAAAAAKVAADTEQHFWFTSTGVDTGAHITEKTQADFIADPTNGGGNLLARSNGIALREGMIELATLQQSGLDVNTYDGGGNLVNIAHLGYGPGTDSGGGTSDAPYYNLGIRTGTVGNYSVAEGVNSEARGYGSHAEGSRTLAGESTAHAEGSNTKALRPHNHSEGYNTTANGVSAHAEGHETTATGDFSHSQNYATIADQPAQTAIGYCNTANNTNNLFAIGNGTLGMRSDCFTVDDSGNTVASGTITTGGHSSPIGDRQARQTTTTKSTGTTWTTVSTSTVYVNITAGTWLIHGFCSYEANATGVRALRLYNNTGAVYFEQSEDVRPAVSGSATRLQCTATAKATTNATIVLQTYQNSGGTRAVDYFIEAIRIA